MGSAWAAHRRGGPLRPFSIRGRVGQSRFAEGALALCAFVAAAALEAADGMDAAPGEAQRKVAAPPQHFRLCEAAIRLSDLESPIECPVDNGDVLAQELRRAIGERIAAE